MKNETLKKLAEVALIWVIARWVLGKLAILIAIISILALTFWLVTSH